MLALFLIEVKDNNIKCIHLPESRHFDIEEGRSKNFHSKFQIIFYKFGMSMTIKKYENLSTGIEKCSIFL